MSFISLTGHECFACRNLNYIIIVVVINLIIIIAVIIMPFYKSCSVSVQKEKP